MSKMAKKYPSKGMDRKYLIYDTNCPFCINVAFFLKHFIQIESLILIPNNQKSRILKLSKKLTKNRIKKDVHFVEISGKRVDIFTGSDAAARVMSSKKGLSFLWKIHQKLPFIFKLIYFISKKIRILILKYYK